MSYSMARDRESAETKDLSLRRARDSLSRVRAHDFRVESNRMCGEMNRDRHGKRWKLPANRSRGCSGGALRLELDLGRATVDEEFDAIDETGIARGKKEGDGRDLFGSSHLAAGDL
jgi:hypothetical protein